MKEQDAAHSFDKEILEKHITYRQLLTFENYSCVGIPYTDALKVIQSVTAELTRLRSELQQERELRKELVECIEAITQGSAFFEKKVRPLIEKAKPNN